MMSDCANVEEVQKVEEVQLVETPIYPGITYLRQVPCKVHPEFFHE
jgi:hypothetical protein